MTDFLASLETYAVAVSALIASVGVIAALLSAGASKESARHARRMFEAEQNADRQRLLSAISDIRSQTLVEIGQARLLGVVLMTEHLADREFQDQLDRQVQKLNQAHDQTEPLILERENEKELECAAHDELERLLRESRKQLHQIIGIEKSLELQGRQQVAKRGFRTPASALSPPLQGHQ